MTWIQDVQRKAPPANFDSRQAEALIAAGVFVAVPAPVEPKPGRKVPRTEWQCYSEGKDANGHLCPPSVNVKCLSCGGHAHVEGGVEQVRRFRFNHNSGCGSLEPMPAEVQEEHRLLREAWEKPRRRALEKSPLTLKREEVRATRHVAMVNL